MGRSLFVGGVAAVLLMCPSAGGEEAVSAPSADGPSPQAVAAMHLLEATDLYQRQLGFLRLEALREPSTLETIRAYISHRDPQTRAYSLRALAAIEGVPAIPVLLHALRTDKYPRVRRAALLALEPLARNDAEVLPALLDALRDWSPEVRMAAVDIVSRINDPRAREAILIRYRRERVRDVRRVLTLAMKRLRE